MHVAISLFHVAISLVSAFRVMSVPLMPFPLPVFPLSVFPALNGLGAAGMLHHPRAPRAALHVRRFAVLLARLDALALLAPPVDEALAERVRASLGRAAAVMGFAPAVLPHPLLAELPLTPALAGGRPYLLLSPSLVEALTDAELDAALRHELTHVLCRGRWVWQRAWTTEGEELACDRLAARSAPEALARAILKAWDHVGRPSPQSACADPALSSLLGPMHAGDEATPWSGAWRVCWRWPVPRPPAWAT